MFTGIVQDIGEVAAIDKNGDWLVTLRTQLPLGKVMIGDSISCNGVCLTVVAKGAAEFKVQVSMETLSRTNVVHWHAGSRVNLEPALHMGDALGGHILSGHIDGIVRVIDRGVSGDSIRYVFEAPKDYARYIAPKGSVALDGVSLTVNDVDDVRFGVNIIPHTQKATTIGALGVGDEVNFEIDLIARYVERMITAKAS